MVVGGRAQDVDLYIFFSSPIILTWAASQRVMGYISSGKFEGAKIHTGGERFGELKGCFIKPAIFIDAKPSMKVIREEIFGPVCPCCAVPNRRWQATSDLEKLTFNIA